MSEVRSQRLYELLPAVYRRRDFEQGEPLRALFGVIERELLALEGDVEGLYDNWFIETCDEWVVPYLGDLLGVRGLDDPGSVILSQRARVANTIGYRRRKGTLATLEQLVRDVTGWATRAVEFRELVATTQHLAHLRPGKGALFDLRHARDPEVLDGPFETAAHTVDVVGVATGEGRYNLPNLGLFLWRLQSYEIERSPAFIVGDGRYTFHPLGDDIPLFTRARSERETVRVAGEAEVPGPIRPDALERDLAEYRERHDATPKRNRPDESAYYGPGRSLMLWTDGGNGRGSAVSPFDVVATDLGEWTRPPAGVAVDVRRGRIAFARGEEPTRVEVSYHYGFSADLGGGPYDRQRTLVRPGGVTWSKTVSQQDPGADFDSLGAALRALADPEEGDRANAIITILDNGTYVEKAVTIVLADRSRLSIQAEDGRRPTVRLVGPGNGPGTLVIGGNGRNAALSLSGLLIGGGIRVAKNGLGQLRILHCTLSPRREALEDHESAAADYDSVVVNAPNPDLELVVDHSIVGSLRLSDGTGGLHVRDSVVDSPPTRRAVPALVSKRLARTPNLGSAEPTVQVTIDGEGPHPAKLKTVPSTLPQAQVQLQQAIREAHGSRAFTGARVTRRGKRLIVLPGVPGSILIELADEDPTAKELGLDPSSARSTYAVVTGPLSPAPELRSPEPALEVRMGREGPFAARLASVPATWAQARDQLEAAIRAAHTSSAFTAALVALSDDGRLVVVSGADDAAVALTALPTDPTTLEALVPPRDRPAISVDGDQPAPPVALERATVFGEVQVKELALASEVLFTAPVYTERRQAGCVRFSFLPEGSRTPRRFRCQPELAIAEHAEELGLDSPDEMAPDERAVLRSRLRPRFTSVLHGAPSFGQLSARCPPEVRTGAEDGSEMGAFAHLQQPQRETNLHRVIEEYLPAGLEAGTFFVT